MLGPGSIAADAGVVADWNGPISGSATLTTAGPGTVVLTAASPAFTGVTNIASGVLALTGAGSLPNSTVVANGTFNLSGAAPVNQIQGLSGSGVVNLGPNALVLAGAANSFSGQFTGSGTLAVTGGTQTLTGTSPGFTGTAAVGPGGALFVNGAFGSNPAAVSTVANGGVLGGNGALGTSVAVAGGGTLSPGPAPGAVGALTVGGALGLNPASVLDFQLGQAGVVDGPLNDLVQVNGNLNLGGVLNVSVSPGGTFSQGVYRLFNYGGTLSGPGLTLGSTPVPGLRLITTIPHEVILAFETFNVWDGAGPRNNGVVDGGNGVWQSSAGNDEWTIPDGSINSSFSDGSTAIFSGKPGVVQVDDSLGAVVASGMRFTVDGYQVTGQPIALAGAQAPISVGDGTAAGAAFTATISAPLTGASQLVKDDLGTLVLAGANSFTGGVRIQGGALQVSSDANLGAPSGGVTIAGGGLWATADMASARSFDITGPGGFIRVDAGPILALTGPIAGGGPLAKTGGGILYVATGGPYAGAIDVAAGVLAVDGDLGAAPVTVEAGASLMGRGVVGPTAVKAGGAIAPGLGLAALTVNGAYSQAAGGVFQVKVDPNSALSDRIVVNGPAMLAGGAVISVTRAVNTPYRLGARWTVLTASGGLTGTYTVAGDTFVSAFAGVVGAYDANDAFLEVAQTRPLTAAAQTPNEGAVASGAQSLAADNPLKGALVMLQDDIAARNAFGQLSGEVYASAEGMMLEDSRFLREAVINRLRGGAVGDATANPGGGDVDPTIWGNVFGVWGAHEASSNLKHFGRTAGGFIAGADTTVAPRWHVGLVGGFAQTSFDQPAWASTGSSNNVYLGAYAGTHFGRLRVEAGAGYEWRSFDVERLVGFAGFRDRLKGDYDAHDAQVFTEAAYRFGSDRASLEPFADAAYVHVETDPFHEASSDKAGDGAALTGGHDQMDSTLLTLGERAAAQVRVGQDRTLLLHAVVGWRHAFGDTTPAASFAFSGGEPFSIQGAAIQRNALALEAGAQTGLGHGVRAGVLYSGVIGPAARDNGVKAFASWSF
jgi:fibronectin-binding autotransporter adhesin